MGLRSIIRERQQFKADPLGQHDTPRPFDQDEVDTRLGQLEDNTEWLCDLTDALLGDNEDDPDDIGRYPYYTLDPEPTPDLPAGAVRNRDDVYPQGNRCTICRVVTLLDVCVGCATGEAS